MASVPLPFARCIMKGWCKRLVLETGAGRDSTSDLCWKLVLEGMVQVTCAGNWC